ncbi:hypothetical protein D9758_019047 [Tetrapyrgos nigripes]|uniref:Uncharacterized protein n=1 Tax=Tetrapyrgos nigripes TaxID=182062 RepID=A0A8H5EY29_9AGAR|nr:hypothetical protein D9758_019047 [Tetrapyrgos nigripes]
MPGRGSTQQRPWGSRKSSRRVAMMLVPALSSLPLVISCILIFGPPATPLFFRHVTADSRDRLRTTSTSIIGLSRGFSYVNTHHSELLSNNSSLLQLEGRNLGSQEHHNERDRVRLHFKPPLASQGSSTFPNPNIHFIQRLNLVFSPKRPPPIPRDFDQFPIFPGLYPMCIWAFQTRFQDIHSPPYPTIPCSGPGSTLPTSSASSALYHPSTPPQTIIFDLSESEYEFRYSPRALVPCLLDACLPLASS